MSGVVYAVDLNGLAVALDAATGNVKWTYQLDDSDETKMTPALYDGILFLGSQQNDASDRNYAITALDPSTGKQLWSQSVPGGLHGSPIAGNGTLYVPVSLGDDGYCRAGGVYAFDERTGQPRFSWTTSPGAQSDGGGIWSGLTYYGGQIVFGSGNTCTQTPDEANAIVSLNTGLTEVWHVNTEPALEDLDVGGTVLAYGGNGYAVGKNGSLYAVNLQTGRLLWATSLGAPLGAGGFATPAIAGQTLIVGGGYVHDPDTYNGLPGGTLFGLSLQGAVKWKIAMNTADLGYAAIANGVAFATLDQSIAALDPDSGKVLWQSPTVGYSYASPVVVPSGVFVADESGRLYAFGLPSTSQTAAHTALSRQSILELRAGQRYRFHRPPTFCKV